MKMTVKRDKHRIINQSKELEESQKVVELSSKRTFWLKKKILNNKKIFKFFYNFFIIFHSCLVKFKINERLIFTHNVEVHILKSPLKKPI